MKAKRQDWAYQLDPGLPIESADKDILGRGEFADALATAIFRQPNGGQATVIGIDGSWGSGKTSVINFVRERLAELARRDRELNNYTEDKVFSFVYRPWTYVSGDDLLADFVESMDDEVSLIADKDDHFAEAFMAA